MGNTPRPLHGSADPRRGSLDPYRFRRLLPFPFFFPFEPDGLFDRGEPFGPDWPFEPDGLFERDESFEPDGAR